MRDLWEHNHSPPRSFILSDFLKLHLILNDGNHRVEISNLYHKTDLPVEAKKGTSYLCTQSDIDDFQHFTKGKKLEVLSLPAAIGRLEGFLDPLCQPPHHVLKALMRLRNAR